MCREVLWLETGADRGDGLIIPGGEHAPQVFMAEDDLSLLQV